MMTAPFLPREQWLELTKLSHDDLVHIRECRRAHNRLGFAYQLTFVKVYNRFPLQRPFETDQDLLTYVAMQVDVPDKEIETYTTRRKTVSEHQIRIRGYLGFRLLGEREQAALNAFLFGECCRLEETVQLRAGAHQFLREERILAPATSTLDRIIGEQRKQARAHVFDRLIQGLPEGFERQLDDLLIVDDGRTSRLQLFKDVPRTPSASAVLRLTEKLKSIADTGVLELDLSWLNNNYQRSLARQAKKSSVHRLRNADASHRNASLLCFLRQTHQDTIDFLIDMLDKLLCRIASQAERDVDEAMKQSRVSIQRSRPPCFKPWPVCCSTKTFQMTRFG